MAVALVAIANQGAYAKKASFQSTGDYPRKALEERREGTVFFEVLVGPDGLGKDCRVTTSSGHADLDQAACATVLRRAKFVPAKDENGNPISSIFRSKMEYKIPK